MYYQRQTLSPSSFRHAHAVLFELVLSLDLPRPKLWRHAALKPQIQIAHGVYRQSDDPGRGHAAERSVGNVKFPLFSVGYCKIRYNA